MRAVVLRHGGTVEEFAGDAVMAVFGIPAAHEDDALSWAGPRSWACPGGRASGRPPRAPCTS
ncbi:MAG TPA: hypothetical protein VHM23_30735 [Actinomycetota bacterium]|nr:hypothetical protein [Actinomycetota bacterium]